MAHYVYRAYDDADVLLYVGRTRKPEARRDRHALLSPWYQFADRFVESIYPNQGEAATAELEAIRTEHPVYNDAGVGGSLAARITAYLVRRFNPPEQNASALPDELLTATDLLFRIEKFAPHVLPAALQTDRSAQAVGEWLSRLGVRAERLGSGERVRSRTLVEQAVGLAPDVLAGERVEVPPDPEPMFSGHPLQPEVVEIRDLLRVIAKALATGGESA